MKSKQLNHGGRSFLFSCRGDYVAFGHSLICSPWGDIVGELDEKEGVLVCDLDMEKVENMRNQIPTSKQRRYDLFSIAEKE